MAEGTVDVTKMKANLKCAVCLETYSDPKQLQCHHIFCLKCLNTLAVPRQNSLTCPTCRVVTPLPAGGVTDVPSAFQITPFLELIDEHKSATSTSSLNVAKVSYCSWHHSKELELYCETCGVLICCKCALKGGSHCDHDYKEIGEALEVYQKDISSTMAPMEKQLTTINKAVAEFDKVRSAIITRQMVIKFKINDTATRLRQNIDVWKKELYTQVDQVTEQKLKKLNSKIQEAKAIQNKYNDSLNSMRKSLDSTDYREVLKMKRATIKEADQVSSSFRFTISEPPVESDMMFSAVTDICTLHGRILKCSIVGDVPSKVIVGQFFTVTLRASSFDGAACEDNISKSIDCEFLSDIAQEKNKVSVLRYYGSDYIITYTPSAEGNYQLHIKVGGHHVGRSPYKIKCAPQKDIKSTPGLLQNPKCNQS